SEETAGSTGSVTSTGHSGEPPDHGLVPGPDGSPPEGPLSLIPMRALLRISLASGRRLRQCWASSRCPSDDEGGCMTDATDHDQTSALLAAYDAQLRGVAEVQGSVSWDQSGPLWRGLFSDAGFVSYESLESLGSVEAVETLIGETVAYFEALPQVKEFEWKTRGHDWPPELDRLLRAHGFEPDE